MQIVQFPSRAEWQGLLKRPVQDPVHLRAQVQQVLDEVRQRGDDALRQYTREWDQVTLDSLSVSTSEWEQGVQAVPAALAAALEKAADNIRRFHQSQLQAEHPMETAPGVKCWRRSVGIERVGLYIPGGSAPLFSTVLMLGIPATLAGCREIILTTPPGRDGSVHPAILLAAKLAGVQQIFKVGGAQAIAAMSVGTATIPAVDKIFGPGNQYVTCAKQMVQMQGMAIDMPAGPSEVCVLADHTAHPAWVAADLLSQAEHGADSQVMLMTTSVELIKQVRMELERQLLSLPRRDVAQRALSHSKGIVLSSMDEALDLANQYAAEHLIIACDRPEQYVDRIRNAGSVFLGHYSPESVGDYASGTNHTLPTNGYARAYSGVSIDSFVKKITFQQLSADGLAEIGNVVVTMAEAEGLQAHARAVTIRMANR